MHPEKRLKTRHIHFFRAGFLAAPVILCLLMQDVTIQEGVRLCYRLAAAFLPSSPRAEFFCSESALQQLSFAPLQYLVSH